MGHLYIEGAGGGRGGEGEAEWKHGWMTASAASVHVVAGVVLFEPAESSDKNAVFTLTFRPLVYRSSWAVFVIIRSAQACLPAGHVCAIVWRKRHWTFGCNYFAGSHRRFIMMNRSPICGLPGVIVGSTHHRRIMPPLICVVNSDELPASFLDAR